MSPEEEEEIGTTIGELNQRQVIYPLPSACINTPILPVKKPTWKYKMVQDFRQLNKMVDCEFPLVSWPISNTVKCATWSVDLFLSLNYTFGIFFSVPLHPDCRNLFSFSYKGTQYTYNRLPPGFCEKPFDLQPCPPEWPKRCSIPWRKHYGSTCWSPFDLFDNSRNLQRLKPSTC